MPHRTTVILPQRAGATPRRACLALLSALLLAGCGNSASQKPADLEARLAALEAKAEQADKRSKEALDIAMSASSSSSGGSEETEGFGEDPLANEELDGGSPPPGNQQGYQTIPAPPPGPHGQPMLPVQ